MYRDREDGLYILVFGNIAASNDLGHTRSQGVYGVGRRLDAQWLEELTALTLEEYVLRRADGSIVAATFDSPNNQNLQALRVADRLPTLVPAATSTRAVLAEDPYVGVIPLWDQAQLAGWLEVHFSVPTWYFVPLQMQTAWGVVVVIAVVLSGGLALLLQRWVMQPISETRLAVQQLRLAPEQGLHLTPRAPSELQELSTAFGELVQQLHYQVQREHFLRRSIAWVNQSRELDTVWGHIWEMTQALHLADVMVVYQHLPNRIHCRFASVAAIPIFGPARLHHDQYSYMEAVYTGAIVEIDDVAADTTICETSRQFHQQHSFQAVLALPLWGQDDVWGCLLLARHTAQAWDSASRQLLEHVSEQLAAALERQDALHHIQLQTHQLHSHNQALEDFISALGHDLRNPLFSQRVALTSLQQHLLASQPSPALLRNTQNCLDLNQALAHLIENLLHISRYQAGRKTLYRELIVWPAVVAGVYQLYEPSITARRLQWSVQIAPELPPVQADSVEIGRVLQNFVANAIRHTPPQGYIQIAIEPINDGVRVLCHDGGSGIEPAIQAVLFQRFFQAGRTTASTGMGLYLCRQIIDAHNGNIGVVSQPSQGSTFWFDLPSYPVTQIIGQGQTADV